MKRKVLSNSLRRGVIKKCGPTCWHCHKRGFIENRFGKPTVLEQEPYKKWVNPYDDSFIFEHKAMQFDHIIPVCKGGQDTVENIVIACENCNKIKGDKCG